MIGTLIFGWCLFALTAVSAYADAGGSAGGQDVYAVLRPPHDRSQIRARFTRIEGSMPVKTATRASDVPLLKNAMAAMERVTARVIEDAWLWGYEDYEVRGRIEEPGDWTDIGLNGNMTADAGRGSDGTRDPQKRRQRFRVWYRRDQVYFAHQKFFDSDWEGAKWPPAFLEAVRAQVAFGVERKPAGRLPEKEAIGTKKPGR